MPRPQRKAPPYDPKAVRRLLAHQAGIASRRQLAELAVTPADLRRLLRRRVLFRFSPGVFAERPGPLSPLQHAWWACLRYPGSVVADESALQLARNPDGRHLVLPVHVALGRHQHREQLPGVALHRVSRLASVTVRTAGPPRMQSATAALRAASRADGVDALVGVLADAVNWRVATARGMGAVLDGLPGLEQRALISEVLADLVVGACSVLERAYLQQVERAHGLPEGQRQEPRRTSSGTEFRDVVYRRFALVVELDGRVFHSGKDAWDNDHERDLEELVAGRDTVRLGWRQVTATPCGTAVKIGHLLTQRGWSGRPQACGPDCPIKA